VIVSLVLTLLVFAPLLGAIVDRTMMRKLHGASVGVSLVVTIGLLLLLIGLAGAIWNQTTSRTLPNFLPNDNVTISGVTLSAEQIITIAVAVLAAVGLRLLFRHTRLGVAMRAVVDDPELSTLTGASSARISSSAWMISTMLAGIAGILLAPQTYMNILELTLLVVYSYSAAVVGRLKSLPLTVVGAMVLGIANSLAIGYAPSSWVSYITLALPMGLLVLAVLVLPQARLTLARVVKPRPPKVASARATLAGSGALVVVAVVFALLLSGDNLNIMGSVLIIGLLALSMVPLSGYGGQVSLCQYTFLGLGCVTMAKVAGGSSVLGVLAAVGVCAGVGALIALPALRLRGLYLALLTLAFAVLMDNLVFSGPGSTWAMGSSGTLSVGRPDIFGLRFNSTRSFVILVAVVLAFCLVGVGALRRSRFGRRLVGMNDSPAACTTVGLDLTRTRLLVFTVSAGMAGLAGALYGGLEQTVSANQFAFELSLAFFLTVMLSGASTLTGPLVAGVFLVVIPVLGSHFSWGSELVYILAGAGAVTIGRYPNGIPQVVEETRAALRRRSDIDRPPRSPASPGAATAAAGVQSVG
jgi:branched-chain amino acid transport system permease protein